MSRRLYQHSTSSELLRSDAAHGLCRADHQVDGLTTADGLLLPSCVQRVDEPEGLVRHIARRPEGLVVGGVLARLTADEPRVTLLVRQTPLAG